MSSPSASPAPLPGAARLTAVSSARSRSCERQGEPEGGALAQRALDPNLPAMRPDDGLADVQAQPQAAGVHPARCTPWRPAWGCTMRGGPRCAVEQLPHPRLLLRRDAWTLVAHDHLRSAPVRCDAYLHRPIA